MNATPYLNPTRFFEKSDIQPTDIRKARKRLMAEFELNDAAEIELQGQRLDKAALLTWLEELEAGSSLGHHQTLAKVPALLAFLEEGKLDFLSQKELRAFVESEKDTASFREFLAPYFVWQYNRLLRQAFKSKDFEQLQKLNTSPLPVNLKDRAACYEDTDRLFRTHLESLKQLVARMKQGYAPGPEVQGCVDELWIESLNALPEHFDGLRNAYGKALEDLAICLYNQFQRVRLAKYVLTQAMKLALNSETRHRLKHLVSQLDSIEPDWGLDWENLRTGTEKRLGIKGWQIALGGLLLFYLIRLILG
jgi:hypothetical protein